MEAMPIFQAWQWLMESVVSIDKINNFTYNGGDDEPTTATKKQLQE